MEQRLYDAARDGDVVALHELLNKDPMILDKICLSEFVETPLHVAALADQTEFAKEVIRLMPSFTMELNKDGFAPLHLASAKGHVEIVTELLKHDNNYNLCFQKDKSGQIPLHHAVARGRIPVMEKLISHCSESLQRVTILGETILHLAVKNSQFEALKVVLNRLKELECFQMLLTTKDKQGKGKTIVELAQATKQLQVLEVLEEYHVYTAKSPGSNDEIMEVNQHEHPIDISPATETEGKQNEKQEPNNVELGNLVLVAAVLIATVTYQAVLTPPTTFWKEGTKLNPRCIFKLKNISIQGRKRYCPTFVFYSFMIFNTAGFLSSVILIVIVTLPYGYKYPPSRFLSISIVLLLANYMVFTGGLLPDTSSQSVVFSVSLALVLVLAVIVSFVFWAIKPWIEPMQKHWKKCKKSCLEKMKK